MMGSYKKIFESLTDFYKDSSNIGLLTSVFEGILSLFENL